MEILSLIDQISPNEIISYKNKKELSILKSNSLLGITWLESKKNFSKDILIDYLSSFFHPDSLQKLNTSLLGSISLIVEYLQKNKNLFLISLSLGIIICVLLYFSRRVVAPFFIAFALSYLLDPLVDKIESRGVSRTASVLFLIVAFFMLVVFAGVFLFPLLRSFCFFLYRLTFGAL